MFSDFGKEIAYQDAIDIVKKHRKNFLDIYKGDKWVKRGEVEDILDEVIKELEKEMEKV